MAKSVNFSLLNKRFTRLQAIEPKRVLDRDKAKRGSGSSPSKYSLLKMANQCSIHSLSTCITFF